MSDPAPANILIVDDTPANLQLLSEILKKRGYKTRPVTDAKTALAAAIAAQPDLILLDINMPEMDGYELCRRLKSNPKLRDVPVIFISALNETIDKVKAFGCGGVDYVTKPFHFEEVEARVRVHLQLRRQNLALQESYAKLERLESLRDDLVHMLVHDLRSPLAASIMSLGYASTLPNLDPEVAEQLNRARDLNSQIAEQVNQILDISRMEAGQLPLEKSQNDLVDTARVAMHSLTALAEKRTITLHSPEALMAFFDRSILRRVITNLIANAIKFTAIDGCIDITINQVADSIHVSVKDNGIGIPPEHHSRIFEKFGQAESGKKRLGTGLGLTFCQLSIQAHGGKIGLSSQPGKGSDFWISLPVES